MKDNWNWKLWIAVIFEVDRSFWGKTSLHSFRSWLQAIWVLLHQDLISANTDITRRNEQVLIIFSCPTKARNRVHSAPFSCDPAFEGTFRSQTRIVYRILTFSTDTKLVLKMITISAPLTEMSRSVSFRGSTGGWSEEITEMKMSNEAKQPNKWPNSDWLQRPKSQGNAQRRLPTTSLGSRASTDPGTCCSFLRDGVNTW